MKIQTPIRHIGINYQKTSRNDRLTRGPKSNSIYLEIRNKHYLTEENMNEKLEKFKSHDMREVVFRKQMPNSSYLRKRIVEKRSPIITIQRFYRGYRLRKLVKKVK